ncbi:response regulator transcription factor [Salisediminibacterium halotolerans]|uniref:response regulator transcription factor n=1 Tax=Salisediminibacterium halotolerans TaxID=517425 RepID=UPI000EB19B1A|nr:LuxR C-terminal-related transcriptional regulator [Salisediminibacterium halotolerans]RLJ71669.1 regulatory LuxR family protein [Actinophytocola xinjiangensis]RPE86819.1 regulatory LuxR family protein [Salisediminibacterium halotolerans]TWG32882.1 regulatory LuxR family protein [Salisediminibacterium halotolerans]GEL06974.1 hypothetical protein SHA02_03900 [Salisediminibacterium halotolerans]
MAISTMSVNFVKQNTVELPGSQFNQAGSKTLTDELITCFCDINRSHTAQVEAMIADHPDKLLLVVLNNECPFDPEICLYYNVVSVVTSTDLIRHYQAIMDHLEKGYFILSPELHQPVALRINELKLQRAGLLEYRLKEKIKSTLTVIEADVLDHLLAGYDTTAIQKKLFYAPSTINTAISRMLDRYGLHNRAELMTFLFKQNWVESYQKEATPANDNTAAIL